MPGLIRGVARTAVVAGTATAVSNGVSRRQAQKWAKQGAPVQSPYAVQVQQAPPPQQYAAPAPVAAAPVAEVDPMAKLQQLGELHAQGILTDEEFAAKKAQLLAEI
jgi:hypothetical protein